MVAASDHIFARTEGGIGASTVSIASDSVNKSGQSLSAHIATVQFNTEFVHICND
jgi:hypothetical protein